MEKWNKKLLLEDGSQFYGYGFGSQEEKITEIVFNTAPVGYQEILSDHPTHIRPLLWHIR